MNACCGIRKIYVIAPLARKYFAENARYDVVSAKQKLD